ncbi:TPA: ead/Ea22-like family protein [Enterobacter hormaechei]
MSNIDKQALRQAAEKATPGPWFVHDKPCEDGNYGIDTSDKEFLAEAVVWWGFSRQSIWREEDAKHIAAANPATVLALLDELEAKDKHIAELEAREVVLPQRYSMLHRVDFHEPYHTEMVYKQHQVLEALHDAGVNVAAAGKGE